MEECSDNLIGRTLGGTYELLRELGRGGMGTVYVARHVRLETSVAVKVLPSEQAGSDEAVLRFRREAMAASSLGHPGIVRVMDLNADGGVVYMVMEYLQGEDLAAYLARCGALPWGEAFDLFRRICDPIAAAHRAGYIHRDLKPGNIFLARVEGCADQVKILDFGLAKALYRADTAKLTRPGTAMGTPAYMPPEQIEGRDPDIRVDVYALGAILFQMLAGRLPFDAPTLTALFAKVLTEPPPSLAAEVGAGDLPAPVDEAIRRALAKRPEDRFPDVPSLVSAVTLAGAPLAVAGMPPVVAARSVAAPLAPTMTAPGLAETDPRVAPAAEPPSLEAASMVGPRPALRRRVGWWIAAA
ncbi:MAG: protein kinase, partial [Acidobacteriota bacterium]